MRLFWIILYIAIKILAIIVMWIINTMPYLVTRKVCKMKNCFSFSHHFKQSTYVPNIPKLSLNGPLCGDNCPFCIILHFNLCLSAIFPIHSLTAQLKPITINLISLIYMRRHVSKKNCGKIIFCLACCAFILIAVWLNWAYCHGSRKEQLRLLCSASTLRVLSTALINETDLIMSS